MSRSNRQPRTDPPGNDRIAITGMGAVCPLGSSAAAIRDRLDGAGSIAPAAGPVDAPDPGSDVHPKLAKSMGKHLALLLGAAREAHGQAGLDSSGTAPEDIGFFAGMGMVDYRVEDLLPSVLKSLSPDGELDYGKFFSGGYLEIYPLWPLAMLNNVAFCQVAISLGMRGENCVFAPHADGGVLAVAEAVKVLREGRALAVLAGGAGEEISPLSLARAGLHGLGDPAVLGECGAALVLEPLSLAEKRGVKSLAVVGGFGFSCGKEPEGGRPARSAVESAVGCALSAAGLSAGDIDAVICGAGGSPDAVAWETGAVRNFFVKNGCEPVIISTGRILGETFAAGPVLNAMIAAWIMESPGRVRALVEDAAAWEAAGREISRVLVAATSYEGPCAALVIEKTG